MGILDKAIDMLGNNPLPMMDARTKLLQTALALVASNGQIGGLSGLVERFNEAGLGNVIRSWIGTGDNLPVSAEQVQQVLGDGELQQISEETGLAEPEVTSQLADTLPDLIDKLTPDGHIPQGGLGDLSSLLDHFLGRYR